MRRCFAKLQHQLWNCLPMDFTKWPITEVAVLTHPCVHVYRLCLTKLVCAREMCSVFRQDWQTKQKWRGKHGPFLLLSSRSCPFLYCTQRIASCINLTVSAVLCSLWFFCCVLCEFVSVCPLCFLACVHVCVSLLCLCDVCVCCEHFKFDQCASRSCIYIYIYIYIYIGVWTRSHFCICIYI